MSVDYQYPEKEYLLIGKVGKPHGLRGEVKLTCFSRQPENVLKYKHLVLVNPKGTLSPPFEIKKARVQGKNAVQPFCE